MFRRVALVSLLAVCACDGQRADVRTLCAAETAPRAGDANAQVGLDRALADVGRRMRTEEGRRLVARMQESTANPGEILASEARRAGVAPCGFAEAWSAEEERARYEHDVTLLCAYALDEIARGSLLSAEGRALRDRLAALTNGERAGALHEESKRIGLAGCAMAEEK